MSDWMNQCRGFAMLPFAPPDTKPQLLPDAVFRTDHVRLEFDVDLKRCAADATCTTSFTILADRTREVSFDAVAFKVLSVAFEDKKAAFKHDGKTLKIRLPRAALAGERLQVAVRYRLSDTKAGMNFVAPDRTDPKRPLQVWTQSQSDDARCWFPCRDLPSEKATSEVIATVPEGFRAVSNGFLLDEYPSTGKARLREGGKRVFHWMMDRPHSIYLISLCVGRYDEVKLDWDGIPILYYAEKGRAEDAKRGFRATPAVIRFFSEYTGVRYPYPKYAQVAAADYFGGMEHTTTTTQTDAALIDKRAAIDVDFDGLVAHEAAHQWFGDLVTCREWSHAWLNESFATYFQVLFQEHAKGIDEARYELWQNAGNYFDELAKYSRPTVTRQWRESFQLFDRHLYERGACVLHFVRNLMGEENWRRAVQQYLERHGDGCAETRDLVESFRVATGRNLERYVDEWILRAGHPTLAAAYSWDAKARTATLRITQKQAIADGKSAYEFPIDVRFVTPKGTVDFRENLSGAEHAFTYKLPAEPRMALLDPEFKLPIVKVEWAKPRRMWEAQLAGDKDVAGRIVAAQEVSSWGTDAAAGLLEKALKRERFWGVAVEIARALGKMRTPAAKGVLVRALGTKHPKVRRAVVEALGDARDAAFVPVFAGLAARDESYMVAAAAVTALGKTRDKRALPHIERAIRTSSWIDVIRAAGVGAAVELAGTWKAALPFLAPTLPDRVRARAMGAMAGLGKGESEVTSHLLRLARDKSQIVRFTAGRLLGSHGDTSVHAELKKLHKESQNSMERGILDSSLRTLRGGQATDPPKAVRGTAAR